MFELIWELISKIFTTRLFRLGGTIVNLELILSLILSLMLAVLIARTVSNFIKNTLLVKLGIDEGNREAISIIIRYATLAVGFIIVLESMGVKLTSLAVLAGGLGVGIGFGVQDLATNFISGMTLLLDRPIKVGDFVEVDDLRGVVKKITIRSTIIQTNEDSSVVIPNSNIIENKIVNYNYDSPRFSFHIRVTVSEENNPLFVTETLLGIAYQEPAVLNDPSPKVLLKELSEEGFTFDLLVWSEKVKERDLVKSALYFAIEYSFRQRGICLARKDLEISLRDQDAILSLLSPRDNKPLSLGANGDTLTQLLEKQEETPKEETHHNLSLSEALKKVSYFKNFNELELRQLIETGYQKRLQAEEILFHEGDPGDAFYVILSGSVEVFVPKINKSLKIMEPGQFFGELSLMLGIPRTASIKGVEVTTLFAIHKSGFRELLSSHRELYEHVTEELNKDQEELAQRQQQLREMGLVDAEEDDQSPAEWMKKRLQNIFSLS